MRDILRVGGDHELGVALRLESNAPKCPDQRSRGQDWSTLKLLKWSLLGLEEGLVWIGD